MSVNDLKSELQRGATLIDEAPVAAAQEKVDALNPDMVLDALRNAHAQVRAFYERAGRAQEVARQVADKTSEGYSVISTVTFSSADPDAKAAGTHTQSLWRDSHELANRLSQIQEAARLIASGVLNIQLSFDSWSPEVMLAQRIAAGQIAMQAGVHQSVEAYVDKH